MPPKDKKKEKEVVADEPDPTEEEMEGKVVFTVELKTSTELWAGTEEAPAEKHPCVAEFTFSGIAAVPPPPPEVEVPEGEEPPVPVPLTYEAVKETVPVEFTEAEGGGVFPFALRKIFLMQPGLPTVQYFLNASLTATLYTVSEDAKTGGNAKVAVGKCEVDLLPLVTASATSVGGDLPIQPCEQENLPAGHPQVELISTATMNFTASLREPLLPKEDTQDSAIMTLKMSCEPLPAGFVKANTDMGAPFNMMATFPWDGQQVWLKHAVMEKYQVTVEPEEGAEEGAEPQVENRHRMVWEGQERFFIPSSSTHKLKWAIRDGLQFDLELARFLKEEKVELLNDPYYDQYHAMGKVTGLRSLVEPGRSTATCKCVLEQFPKLAPTEEDPEALTPSLLPPAQPLGGKATVPDDITDRTVCPWVLNESYLTLDLELSHSLLPPWEAPPKPKQELKELLPKRPPQPPVCAPVIATEGFKDEVRSTVALLADQYFGLFGDTKPIAGDTEARRKKLVFHLNRTGGYFNIKESLKGAVVKVVKERFTKTANMSDAEFQELHNSLYVYLLQEMHAVLQGLQAGESLLKAPSVEPAQAPPVGDARMADYGLEKLMMLADEYEVNDDWATAAQYQRQRLLLAPEDVQIWYSYGSFCLRSGEMGQAEEALREALSYDPTHKPTLLALALMHLNMQEQERAAIYAHQAMELEKSNSLPWMLLFYVYFDLKNEKEWLNCEWEFKRLKDENSQNTEMDAAVLMLDYKLGGVVERVLKDEPRSVNTLLCLARAALDRQDFEKSHAYLNETLSQGHEGEKDPRTLELLGHLHFTQGALPDAIDCYQKALAFATSSCALQVYIRLGKTYLKMGKFEEARQLYMSACSVCPCASVWSGLAEAYLRLGMFPQAEDCLVEANLLDYLNPAIWALLALTCLERERPGEAEQALQQAYRHGLQDPDLLARIGRKYYSTGEFELALQPLRLAAQNGGGPAALTLLGDALFELNDTTNAKTEYQVALDKCLAPADKLNVLPQLIKVTSARGEHEESRAYTVSLTDVQSEIEEAKRQEEEERQKAAAALIDEVVDEPTESPTEDQEASNEVVVES